MKPFLFGLVCWCCLVHCTKLPPKKQAASLDQTLFEEVETEVSNYMQRVAEQLIEELSRTVTLETTQQEALKNSTQDLEIQVLDSIEVLVAALSMDTFEKKELIACLQIEGQRSETCVDKLAVLMRPVSTILKNHLATLGNHMA